MTQLNDLFSKWFGNRSSKQSAPVLGPREIEVLKLLWRYDSLSVQQIMPLISDESISTSTLQSTLERLFKKGVVSREKSGRAFVYQATMSQSVIIGQILQDVTEQLSDGELAPVISGFIDFVVEENAELAPEQLDKLKNTINKND